MRQLKIYIPIALLFAFVLSLYIGSHVFAQEDCQTGSFSTTQGNPQLIHGWQCKFTSDSEYISLSSDTVDRSTYVTASLDSGNFACPPYTWSINGNGFHFNNDAGPQTEITSSITETLEIWADDTACGSAIIIVTDACGACGRTSVREPNNGYWDLIQDESCGVVGSCPIVCCTCYNCSSIAIGAYTYQDCWIGGTVPGRYEDLGCGKWPYTTDLSGSKCSCPGYMISFYMFGMSSHRQWKWQCD